MTNNLSTTADKAALSAALSAAKQNEQRKQIPMKSNIVLTLKDNVSSCTFAIIDGVVHQIVSGGIDAAQVLRKANAVLTGTSKAIIASVEAAFNRDQEDDLYRAELVEQFAAELVEAGNGLPYVGDLVYSGETNLVYKITTCSRVQVGNGGKGNSVEVTLIEAGSPDDYTETAFANILDCRVDILEQDESETDDE